MKIPVNFIIIISLVISVSGCATQAVLNLTDRSVENQKILAQQHANVANAFNQQLSTEVEMVKLVGSELSKQCDAINQRTHTYAQALISNSKLKIKQRFYEQVIEFQNKTYPQQFNTAYAPLEASFKVYEAQLKELENAQTITPLDVDVSRKIIVKKTQILAVSGRHSRDDLDLRETYFEKILKYKTTLFDNIDAQYTMINPPAGTDCKSFNNQAQDIAKQLLSLQASLAAHYGQLDTLNDQQLQTLLTLKNNVDRSPIYELILEGASDNLKTKLTAISSKLSGLLTPLSSTFDQFLGKLSNNAFQSLGNLTGTLNNLETNLTKSINNKFSDLIDEIPNHVNNLINQHAASPMPAKSQGEE